MVISDFNIVCLNQCDVKIVDYKGIETDIVLDGYGEHWKALKTCGIWYQFYPSEREITRKYNDEFFDLSIINNIYHLILLDNHCKDIKTIIDDYVALSPIHEIIVLFRLDEHGESDEITDLSVQDFIENLNAGELLFNRVYKVSL